MKLCTLTHKLSTRFPVNVRTIAAYILIMRKHILYISLKKTNVLWNKYIIKLLENIQEQIVFKRTNLFQEQTVLQKTDFLVNKYFSKIMIFYYTDFLLCTRQYKLCNYQC
jgi:hypothetical protein